ncbi:MAG: hypothetical protein HYZ87_01765, partial [Candidatus Omnitrophica bacterium]|nr:hypothetical protein [Candidatus Omnitrophota bacterium]
MSEWVESLKAAKKSEKSEYEMTQEQLANIYFSGTEKQKKLDYPVVIKVVEKPKLYSVMPWLISSVALLVMAFSLFSTKRIFVDINVVDESHPYATSLGSSRGLPVSAGEEKNPASSAEEPIVSGNRIVIQNFIFEGAAKLKSSKDNTILTLVNSSIASFARASV